MSKGFQDRRYRDLIGRLIAQRKELRLTQATLAKRLGRHQQFVSRYETGERRLDVVEFADIAAALELSATDLLVNVKGYKAP